MFLHLLVILVLIILLFSLYCRYNREGRLLSKIPSPRGVPIFSNLFDLILSPEQLFQFSRDMCKKHGSFYKLSAFNIRSVNVCKPEDVEIILSSVKFIEKQVPYTFLRPWLGNGLLVSNGDLWQERRKMLTHAFHFNILKKFLNIFIEETDTFLTTVQKEVTQERTDITPLIVDSTLKIMCKTAMGSTVLESIQSIFDKYLNAIHKIGRCLTYRINKTWLHAEPLYVLTKMHSTQQIAIKDLHALTKEIVRERKMYREINGTEENLEEEFYKRKNTMVMLDLLLEQEKLGKIDENSIREEVDTFMFEGHDTTAMALRYFIMRIANERDVQNKIYEELYEIFGVSQRSPTMDDLNKMKYLECCIKESLRIYPSVPYIARQITEEVVLSGYRVPANTICSIHIYDVHRNEEIYPDPERFIPERFLLENCIKRHPYAYIPFSAGPRNCIGQKFALLEIKTIMSGLLRRFRLEPITRPNEITFVADIVLRTKEPIYVRFRERIFK